jgi:hypothetical protein
MPLGDRGSLLAASNDPERERTSRINTQLRRRALCAQPLSAMYGVHWEGRGNLRVQAWWLRGGPGKTTEGAAGGATTSRGLADGWPQIRSDGLAVRAPHFAAPDHCRHRPTSTDSVHGRHGTRQKSCSAEVDATSVRVPATAAAKSACMPSDIGQTGSQSVRPPETSVPEL